MTPTAGSDFSRYVIPDDLNPSGICCISVPVPDDRQWRAMFFGALWRLSLQTHWERDEAHSAKVVAAKWREIWMEVQDMGCCQTNSSAINIEINSYLVQNMQLAITWRQIWLDATSVVSVAYYAIPATYSTDPADAGDEVSQREQALCLAVQGWLNEVMNYMESWIINNFEDVGLVAGGTFAAAISISGLLMWPVVIGWAVAANIAIDAFFELRSTEYREYLVCRMYRNLLGKNPDLRSDFNEALTADLVGRPVPQTPTQDIARDVIEAYIRSQLNNLDNYLMFAGQLGTAMDIAKAGELTDCPCIEFCLPYTDSFDTGVGAETFLPGDPIIPVTPHFWGEVGIWDATVGETAGGIKGGGTGFFTCGGGTDECIHAVFYIRVPDGCTIQSVQYRVKFSNGGANRAHRLEFYDVLGALVHTQYDELYGATGAWQTDGAVGMAVNGAIWIRIFNGSAADRDTFIHQDSVAVVFAP